MRWLMRKSNRPSLPQCESGKAGWQLTRQYRHVRGIFASARRKRDVTHDLDVRRDVLCTFGAAALAQQAACALLHRERPWEQGKSRHFL